MQPKLWDFRGCELLPTPDPLLALGLARRNERLPSRAGLLVDAGLCRQHLAYRDSELSSAHALVAEDEAQRWLRAD